MKFNFVTRPSVRRSRAASLLPYAIRACAASEMLYGGVRVLGLVQKPPTLAFHVSEKVPLPSPTAERRNMRLDFIFSSMRMMPINSGNDNKYEMSIIRSEDVLRRFLAANRPFPGGSSQAQNGARIEPKGLANENTSFASSGVGAISSSYATNLEAREALLATRGRRMYHVNSKLLSVEADVDRVGSKIDAVSKSPVKDVVATVGTEVFNIGGRSGKGIQFMPLQMFKPVHHNFSPAQRSSGLTNPAGKMRQELLDRKGFGWQKKQRTLWQQDAATNGYRPDKFY